MAGSRTLKLSILADVDNLRKGLDDGGKGVDGFGAKLESFGKVAAAAFAAAAAAAVTYAGKLLIDGVKSAIADEEAQKRLEAALKNVTGATNDQIASVEKQIEKLSYATGIADDNLRPAFQRLAMATGDLDKATKLLNLALDISAATGKPLEGVTNALGKAYEGNIGALGRLGIGLSTAEIKSKGLEGTINDLSKTFQGASDVQANTFQGRIDRIKLAFDEAKETIGRVFLPVLEALLKFITTYILPVFQAFADALDAKKDGLNARFQETVDFIQRFFVPIIDALKGAWEQIKDAILDNKERIKEWLETYQEIYAWMAKYLLPLIQVVLVSAIEDMSRKISLAIKIIVPVVEYVAAYVKFLINGIITQINLFIDAYNAINGLWGGKDVKKIDLVGAPGATKTGLDAGVGFGGASKVSGTTTAPTIPAVTPLPTKTPAGTITTTPVVPEPFIDIAGTTSLSSRANVVSTMNYQARLEAINTANQAANDLAAARYTAIQGAIAGGVNIYVQSPSIIDEEGFSRAVTDALNKSQTRTGAGVGYLVE